MASAPAHAVLSAGASSDGPSLPMVIVPGFCSSCLEVERSSIYPSWQGARVWLGLSRLGFQAMHGKGMWDDANARSLKNKWLEHLMLQGPAEENEGVHLKATPGVEGIKNLDPDSFFGLAAEATYVFAPVIQALEALGYKEGEHFLAASYDWRFAPAAMQQRDGYFVELKKMVEGLNRRGTGVVILGHSMGNKVVAYFLEYAKQNFGQAWLDRHVHSWLATGAPHLGAPQAARATIFGDKFGLDQFVTDSEAVVFARSLSASPWLFPVGAQAQQPMFFLRRGGVLEVRHLRANVPHCGLESKRNAVVLSVEVWWGGEDSSSTECVTTKSAAEFEGGVATFADDLNFLRFAGPAELPANATISVIVKEKGIHDDKSRLLMKRMGKGLVAGMQLIDEAVHGRKGMGVPKANTACVLLTEALRGRRGHDGFVDLRLPIASVRQWLPRASAEDYSKDYISLQARWLDYRAVRQQWLGSQELAPASSSRGGVEVPVRHSRDKAQAYDPVEVPQLLRMEGCHGISRTWRDYYEADPCYDHTGVRDCPPIRRVVAVYGVNMPTEVAFALRISTMRIKPAIVQTWFVLDGETELAQAGPSRTIDGGVVKEVVDGGDGVVPRCSLDHCKDWAGRLDLSVIHLNGVEHRGMLADPRFHKAIQDALTPGSVTDTGLVAGPRATGLRPQPAEYSMAGTWNDWAPSPMQWDGVCFSHVLTIGKKGWESFQILLRGNWETVIYPSVKNASPSVAHELRGPDAMNKGLDWTIGRPGFNPLGIGAIAEGTEYLVVLSVDDRGRAQSVTWEPHIRVESFAKAPKAGRWQAAKNATEWWDCPADVSQQLSAARAKGLARLEVRMGRGTYEVDLHRMVQKNLATGTERPLRVVAG